MKNPVKPELPKKPHSPNKNQKVNKHVFDLTKLFVIEDGEDGEDDYHEMTPSLESILEFIPSEIKANNIFFELKLGYYEQIEIFYTTPFNYEEELKNYQNSLAAYNEEYKMYKSKMVIYKKELDEYKKSKCKDKLNKRKVYLKDELRRLK